jgi:hypothetical protein
MKNSGLGLARMRGSYRLLRALLCVYGVVCGGQLLRRERLEVDFYRNRNRNRNRHWNRHWHWDWNRYWYGNWHGHRDWNRNWYWYWHWHWHRHRHWHWNRDRHRHRDWNRYRDRDREPTPFGEVWSGAGWSTACGRSFHSDVCGGDER